MTKADIVDKVHENLFYRNGYTKNECFDPIYRWCPAPSQPNRHGAADPRPRYD